MQSSLIEVNFIGGQNQRELGRTSWLSQFFYYTDMLNLLLGITCIKSGVFHVEKCFTLLEQKTISS